MVSFYYQLCIYIAILFYFHNIYSCALRDGIHYSLLTDSEKYYSKNLVSSKCESRMRSGSQLCGAETNAYLPKILVIPGISECEDGELYYCGGSKGTHLFDMFEGGVSKMMTMAWINKICN